jgi:ribosomal protein S18 acetylase RimI-like enzyme
VLLLVPALTAELRSGVVDLERRVVAADGGRLKLEWGVLDGLPPTAADPRLALEVADGRVVGFLGMYAFGGDRTAELAGMVDPEARRRGIGSALLGAVLPLCRQGGRDRVLLVTPRNGAGGAEFARAHGGRLEASEHALVLRGDPVPGPSDPAITMRQAGPADADAVGRLLKAAFDWTPNDLAGVLGRPDERTMLVHCDGVAVGTVRLTMGEDSAGIYGFAVDPVWQGRGIGRDVLRRCCRQLREDGAAAVGLEVAVDNERALGLYTSLGFERVLTEDYYRLPAPVESSQD